MGENFGIMKQIDNNHEKNIHSKTWRKIKSKKADVLYQAFKLYFTYKAYSSVQV